MHLPLVSLNSSPDTLLGPLPLTLLFPHQDTTQNSTGGACLAVERVPDKEGGVASHKPLSFHRWQVTVLMKGS